MTEDVQLGFFGEQTPPQDLPRAACSNDEQCGANADDHLETCPVERGLREEFGF